MSKISPVKYDNNTTQQISDDIYNSKTIITKHFFITHRVKLKIKLFLAKYLISTIALLEARHLFISSPLETHSVRFIKTIKAVGLQYQNCLPLQIFPFIKMSLLVSLILIKALDLPTRTFKT